MIAPSSSSCDPPTSSNRDGRRITRLGRGAIELTEPLAALTVALRDQPAGRDRAAAALSDWLLPGYKHAIISPPSTCRPAAAAEDHRARHGRHAALITLAEQLPAPILAERLGLHHTRAAEWARAAGATHAAHGASRWGGVPVSPRK